MTRRRLIAPLVVTAAAGTWYALSPGETRQPVVCHWSIYFAHCMTGPAHGRVGENAGGKFDFDSDGFLTLRDYAEFQRTTGPKGD